MSTDVQTTMGTCPTHGTVTATRTIPALRFPYVVYAIARTIARRRPYRCPECESAVRVEPGRVP